jgi:hypothetical protein
MGHRKDAWRRATVAGGVAILLAILSFARFGFRAATCTGSLVRDSAPMGARAREVAKTSTPKFVASQDGWLTRIRGSEALHTKVYALGAFRLRSESISLERSSFYDTERTSLEDPTSCDGEALPLFYGSVTSPPTATESIALGKDTSRDEWVVTFRTSFPESEVHYEVLPPDPTDPVVGGEPTRTGAVAFRKTASELPMPSLASIAGIVFLLFGLRDLRRGARYFRRGGMAGWRAGTMRSGDSIEPRDGGPLVHAADAGAPAGSDVLFTVQAPGSPTYRTPDRLVASGVYVGSHDELRPRHARWTWRALVLLGASCLAFAVAVAS